MSVLEFQFRKQVFLDYFKAQINGQRLPFPTFDFFALPQIKGHLLERIECVSCSADPTGGDGQVTIQAQLAIHYHTSLATIRAAGSLKPPVTEQVPVLVPIVLSIKFVTPPGTMTPQPQLQWRAAFGLFPPGVVPLNLPDGITIKAGGVDASDDIIAIRLGTEADDPVRAPITNRIGDTDWSQLVPGSLIASQLAANLGASLAGVLSADLVLDSGPSGAWIPFAPNIGYKAPYAIASADVVAVDKCIFNIDISVAINLVSEFEVSGNNLTTTLTLSWDADSTLCDIVGTLLLTPLGGIAIHVIAEDKASSTILGTSSTPDRFHQTGSTDSSVTYQSVTSILPPSPAFSITHVEVNGDGLLSQGKLSIQRPPRGLDGSVSVPRSVLHTDCHTRSVSVRFEPAQVYLEDIGIGGAPRLFPPGVLFDPPGAWSVVQGVSNSWLELLLTFPDPPGGRLPAGTHTSVFIDTDCGVRWVDLGVIPVDHAMPTLQDIGGMISQCLAKSNPWGVHSVVNLKWLVDPPDAFRGMPPMRQWTVAQAEVPEGVSLELLAVGATGSERRLGVLTGARNLSAQVITHADETLQVRANRGAHLQAPKVSQRWISPVAAVRLRSQPRTIAAAGGMIAIRSEDGRTEIVQRASDGRVALHNADRRSLTDASMVRLMAALARQERYARGAWATSAALDRQTVAVTNGEQLLIGIAGPASQG